MSAVLQPRPSRRAMTVLDLDAVVAVEQRAYSHPWSRGNFTDSLAAGYLAEIWLQDDKLLGYFVAMTGVDELHLLNITVVPEQQGQGHGRTMMAALQQHALAFGAASLWLEVRESNHRARALYRRLGFAEVGLRRGYYPAAVRREDAVVMSLVLAGLPSEPKPHAVD
jgi:[ribosomal protein S18]-alanine N-acetyltransferase